MKFSTDFLALCSGFAKQHTAQVKSNSQGHDHYYEVTNGTQSIKYKQVAAATAAAAAATQQKW